MHWWAPWIGVVTKANRNVLFVTFVDHISLDSKHTEARFSPNATDSLYLLVAQVPRPRDMAIFLLTTTTTTRPITVTLPLARARGVKIWLILVHSSYSTVILSCKKKLG